MRESHRGENADVQGLLARAIRGEEDAWRDLLALYTRRVFGLVRSRCGNDELAEEITQSVFATVAVHLGTGRYHETGRFESWLFRVAMNRLRDEMRRRSRQAEPTDPAEFRAMKVADSASTQGDAQSLADLKCAIGHLGAADREIIELRHHAELSFKAIAEILEQPMGTILARHHRALKKLRELMEPQEPTSHTRRSTETESKS